MIIMINGLKLTEVNIAWSTCSTQARDVVKSVFGLVFENHLESRLVRFCAEIVVADREGCMEWNADGYFDKDKRLI